MTEKSKSSDREQLATLLRQVWKDRDNPLADDILEQLIHMIVASDNGDRYRVALHHQKACELLERYAKLTSPPNCTAVARDDEESKQ